MVNVTDKDRVGIAALEERMDRHPKRRRSAFQIDLEKYYVVLCKTQTPSVSQKIRVLVFNMGVHCIAVYRFGQFAQRLQARHRIIGRMARVIYLAMNHGIGFIHKVGVREESEIGPGFHICHVGNIYLGPHKIGKNCTVTHNVTIGVGLVGGAGRRATIGDNVWIGTGSVVVGDITIGDGVTISAGSIVTRNVSAGCLVAGNPARVIARDYDNSGLLEYKMNGASAAQSDPQGSTVGSEPQDARAFVAGSTADGREPQGTP
jgi:serine O-acetyltransferase